MGSFPETSLSHFFIAPGEVRQSWILDSTLWIPDSRYWIPDSLSVELKGFRIPIFSWIPDSLR